MASITIPWWGKICAKVLLSRFSFGYAVWQRLGLFRHGQMDSSAYAIRVFNSHAERSGFLGSLNGKTLVEMGPGDSIATAIIAKAYGARAILVDAGAFVRADIEPCLELVRALRGLGLQAPDLSACRTIDDVLVQCEARYMTEGLTSLQQIEGRSVDLIFSQAVLEHVRKHEFLKTMRECRRILRLEGICSHQVDLRDHLGGALNNLRFSEKIWESNFFTSSGFYTNRIQFNRMLDWFSEAGFRTEVCEIRRWNALPTSRNRLASEFNKLSDDELNVSGFDVLLR